MQTLDKNFQQPISDRPIWSETVIQTTEKLNERRAQSGQERSLATKAMVEAPLASLVVMSDLDDVAIRVAKVLGIFGQALGSERLLAP